MHCSVKDSMPMHLATFRFPISVIDVLLLFLPISVDLNFDLEISSSLENVSFSKLSVERYRDNAIKQVTLITLCINDRCLLLNGF